MSKFERWEWNIQGFNEVRNSPETVALLKDFAELAKREIMASLGDDAKDGRADNVNYKVRHKQTRAIAKIYVKKSDHDGVKSLNRGLIKAQRKKEALGLSPMRKTKRKNRKQARQ